MNIRFHIPNTQLIPTDLRLICDEIPVRYERIQGGFKFEVYTSDHTKAREVVDEIIRNILIDKDEPAHGISWRTVSLVELESPWDAVYIYEWHYRVRDAY